MIIQAGQPIKDRGIRWTEAYADKSAYLKEQFETQVGPGSYFRWEGHDFTTSSDYYVVVAPGFSKKHGYHFFAGLRKEPAENGASGKHFQTQGEALSYAMDKWNIPRPESQPHKPYVAADLEGKDIVVENVHASSDSNIVTAKKEKSSMIIIDATGDAEPIQKTAMALHSMVGPKFVRQFGKNTLSSVYQYWPKARSIMGDQAALHLKKEMVVVDYMNWNHKAMGHNDQTGKRNEALPHSPLLSTCSDVDQSKFDEAVHNNGITIVNQLFNFKGNELTLKPPTNAASENYSIVKPVSMVFPSITVSWQKKAAFEQALNSVQGMSSEVDPKNTISVTKSNEPANKRQNYQYSGGIPIDLYKQFSSAVSGSALVRLTKSVEKNSVKIYDYFEAQGKTKTPDEKKQVLETPMFEEFANMKGGQAVAFEKGSLRPLGINPNKSPQKNKESDVDELQADESIQMGEESPLQYEFKEDVVNGWMQQYNYDSKALRHDLVTGKLPIDHSMFVDSRTCSPKLLPISSEMPVVGLDMIPQVVDGKVVTQYQPVVPQYNIKATNGVRVYNPETDRQHYQAVPLDIEKDQSFNGAPSIAPETMVCIPSAGANGETELHEIDNGEWRHFDSKSKGKFIPGYYYRFMVTPKNVSPKKSDKKSVHELGLDRGGWGMYTAKTFAKREWHDGAPPANNPQVSEVVTNPSTGKPVGYYTVTQRQNATKPFMTAGPKPEKPLAVSIHEQDANGNVISTGQEFTLGEDKAFSSNANDGLIVNRLQDAINFLKYKYGLNDMDLGPIPDVDRNDLRTIDEKVNSAMTKIQAVKAGQLNETALEDWEKMLSKFQDGTNTIPMEVFDALVAAKTDPTSWDPKMGQIFGVWDENEAEFIDDEGFTDHATAEKFKEYVASSPQHVGQQSLSVQIKEDNVPLVSSFRKRLELDPNAQFVANKDVFQDLDGLSAPEALNMINEEENAEAIQDQPGDAPQDASQEVVSDEAVAEQPVETGVEAPVVEQPVQEAPQEPQDFDMLMDDAPVEPAAQPVQTPIPMRKPFSFDFKPKPKPVLVDHEAESIGRLVKLANRLDDEGKTSESNAVDRLIKILINRNQNGN